MKEKEISNSIKSETIAEIEKKIRQIETELKYIDKKLDIENAIGEIERNLKLDLKDINIEKEDNNITMLKIKDAERKFFDVLSYNEKSFDNKEIERVSQKLKMREEDIVELLENGMNLKKIEEQGINLIKESMKENSPIDSDSLKEAMLIENADNKQNRVTTIQRSKDGEKTIISSIDEIAKVNENGELEFSDDMKKSLDPFEKVGAIDLNEKKYLVREKEESKDGKIGKDIYRVLPEKELERRKNKQEKEKEEIASSLNQDPKKIIAIVRVNDTYTCSQLLNDDRIRTTGENVLIVKFRNNEYRALKEDGQGNRTELVGFKAKAPLKAIAPALENKVGSLYSNWNVNDVTAGKRIDGGKYDTFFIDTGTKGDGIGILAVTPNDGKNNLDIVKPSSENGYDIESADTERVYPATVVMDSHESPKEKKVIDEDENMNEPAKDEDDRERMAFEVADNFTGDLEEQKRLLEELLEIENELNEIKQAPDFDLGIFSKNVAKNAIAGSAIAGEEGAIIGAAKGARDGIRESKEAREEKISDLEKNRDEIMGRLGYSSSDLTKAIDDAERYIGDNVKH